MVTEIIKQEDVDIYCTTFNHWIRYGITNDAVDVCRHKWNYIPDDNYSYGCHIRNKDFNSKPIQPVIKW